MAGHNMGVLVNFEAAQLARNPDFQASAALIAAARHFSNLTEGGVSRDRLLEAWDAVTEAMSEN
jgi:hypothetical protein